MTGGGLSSEKQDPVLALNEAMRPIFGSMRLQTAMLRRYAFGFQHTCTEFSNVDDMFRATFPPPSNGGWGWIEAVADDSSLPNLSP